MKKSIDLALQGGGSHGAFAWGVIERLLEDDRLKIEGLCGTSAGAMNATITAYGLMKGGNRGAIDLLNRFWATVAKHSLLNLVQPSPADVWEGNGGMDYSPSFMMMEVFTHVFSPYQTNPMNVNPLEEILSGLVDFDELKSCNQAQLFICATNVLTGRARVFSLKEISLKAVMASACIPSLFKAVEIDGQHYWDGGFMGNPPLYPLIDHTDTNDILIVQVNPINIEKVPTTALEIRDRINELSFNASLMQEMRKVNFVKKMLAAGMNFKDKPLKELFIHSINPEKEIAHYKVSSKLNADLDFLLSLKKIGIDYADAWIKENYRHIGKQSTVNIQEMFL